jgi:hypothetical protein
MHDKGVECTCENGHTQRILTPDYTIESAEMLASLFDSMGEVYLSKPKENPIPGSPLGKCGICGAWMHAQVFGYG